MNSEPGTLNREATSAPPASGALTQLAGWAMAALGLGGYVLWLRNGGLVSDGNWVGVDFHTYYKVAQVLRAGGDIYQANVSPPYVYPPLLALLVVPLTFLSATWATILWKLLQHICLLVAGWLLVTLVPARIRPLAAGFLVLCLLTVPLRDEIQLGESNSLILLLVAWTLWLVAGGVRRVAGVRAVWPVRYTERREAQLLVAGLLLGLAVSIKVLPALLLLYFALRGPRAVAAVATWGFLVIQALLLVLTHATATYWSSIFPGLFGQLFPYTDNQSFNAFFSRAFLPTDPSLPAMQIATGDARRLVLTWTATIFVLLGTVLVLLFSRQRTPDPPSSNTRLLLEAGLVLLTTHLASGSTWIHHLIDLAVPLLGLLAAWWLSRRSRVGAVTLAVGAALVLLVLARHPASWVFSAQSLAPGNNVLALLASALPMWAMIGLWAAVAWRLVTLTTDDQRPDGQRAASRIRL